MSFLDLINNQNVDINKIKSYEPEYDEIQNAFIHTIKNKNYDILKILLKYIHQNILRSGEDIYYYIGTMSLYNDINNNDIVNVDDNIANNDIEFELIKFATKLGYKIYNIDRETIIYYGLDSLLLFIKNNRVNIVKYLLNKHIDKNTHINYLIRGIYSVCSGTHPKILKLLLYYGAPIKVDNARIISWSLNNYSYDLSEGNFYNNTIDNIINNIIKLKNNYKLHTGKELVILRSKKSVFYGLLCLSRFKINKQNKNIIRYVILPLICDF